MEEAKNNLLERVKALKESLRLAEADNQAKEARIVELQMKLEELSADNAKLRSDYNRLKLAKAYAWDEKSKNNATLRINNIVNKIESCIALLQDEINH